MIVVFFIFAALLIYLSYKSLAGGIDYLNYFKSRLAKSLSDNLPFATVIVPCRGLDEGLADNLATLMRQEYPSYEVIFIVDDENDPAVSVIQELISRGYTETRSKENSASLIVAAKAKDSSQKVENLREAVLHASDESRVFAFVDSDARPSADWLRHLVAPLDDEKVGAATGYRWFISKKPTLGSELRSAWNASIATALGPKTKSNFCWGGSMAIRRDTFERLGMREKWKGTLSDDFAVTRAMNEENLPIVFVPQALTATVEDCTFAEMLEFTTRQMKITCVYAPKLWAMSFLGSGLFVAVMIAAFLIVILERQDKIAIAVAITTLFLVSAFSIGKSWLRLSAARLILTNYRPELKQQFWTQNTLWLLTPAIFFYNCVSALLSRRVRWRGTVYELKSPTETVIISS